MNNGGGWVVPTPLSLRGAVARWLGGSHSAAATGRCRGVVRWLDDAIGGEEGEGEPGKALKLVDVFDLRSEIAAEGENGGGEGGRIRVEFEDPAGEGIRAPGGDDDVNDNADLHRNRCGEEDERPVEGIEHSGLRVGDERRAHEEVRIPKWQSPGKHGLRTVVPVWIEVEQGIAACEDEVGEGGLTVEEDDEGGEA